jgi:hypothetical protein
MPWAATVGGVLLVLDLVDALERLQRQVVRLRIEANRPALLWLRENEPDFDAAHAPAYMDGWNKELHELVGSPPVEDE